jgi:hypothetical protein
MSRFRGPRGLTIWLVLLPLLGEASCSRPAGLSSSEGAAQADPHQVPFHDGDGSAAGNSHPGVPSMGQDSGAKPETGLPFRDPQSLAAGTLLTVRLKSSVSADNPAAKGSFDAVVDEPVIIEGSMLVPRGAVVAGRVESARASQAKRNRGYMRLTLDSIDIAGRSLRVRTSSLFARGNAPGGDASVDAITLEKGRRLTFRLTETVYLAGQQASSGH